MEEKEKKEKIGFYMSQETIDKFRRFVQDRYKTYRNGILSAEAEAALVDWMTQHKDTHIKPPNPAPRIAIVWKEVKEYMEQVYDVKLYTGITLSSNHIKNGIRGVRGSDPRTVKRWFMDFHRSNVIKELGGDRWELM